MKKKLSALEELVKAFEDYVSHTVAEYGESRMFDCGVDEARKAIKKAKKASHE